MFGLLNIQRGWGMNNKVTTYHPPTADCDVNSLICKQCGALPGEGCKVMKERLKA